MILRLSSASHLLSLESGTSHSPQLQANIPTGILHSRHMQATRRGKQHGVLWVGGETSPRICLTVVSATSHQSKDTSYSKYLKCTRKRSGHNEKRFLPKLYRSVPQTAMVFPWSARIASRNSASLETSCQTSLSNSFGLSLNPDAVGQPGLGEASHLFHTS